MKTVFSALQQAYLSAMKKGSGKQADLVVQQALDIEIPANDIYLDIFQKSAYEIGEMWQRNEFSVAQEHLATAIIERQMSDLHSYFKPRRDRRRKLLLGAVDLEQHRIGMRMVADFFEQDGWDVYYLGAAVPTRSFVFMAKEFQPDLIGISAQMVYHLPELMNFVRETSRQGLDGIPIMAGGFPFVQDPELYKKLGVHFSGVDAGEAVALANRITGPEGGI